MLKSGFAFFAAAVAVTNVEAGGKNANVGINETTAGSPTVENAKYGVEYVGNSGQFRLFFKTNSTRSVKIKMAKLEEYDTTGKVTTNKETLWANKATAWSAIDGVCPEGTNATTCTKVSFNTTIDVGPGKNQKAQFSFDTYLIHNSTNPEPVCTSFNITSNTCDLFRCINADKKNVDCVKNDTKYCLAQDGINCTEVMVQVATHKQEENTLKFTVKVSDWPFLNENNTLHFGVNIEDNGGAGDFNTTNDAGTELTTVKTPSGSVKLEQYVTVKDAQGNPATKQCNVSLSVKDVTMVFPHFVKSMVYDPTLSVDASATTSTSTATSTPGPSTSATPSLGSFNAVNCLVVVVAALGAMIANVF